MKSINKIDEISEDDEHILADMIENGDEEERTFAIELLITSNLKLVVKIAHDYRRDKTLEFEDIVSAGNTGLMKAAERFRNGYGAKFSTHAAWWIKQAIRRYIDNKGLIRIPCAYSQKIKKVFSIKNDYENKNQKEPTIEELSKLSGFSVDEVKNIMRRRYETSSLDMEIGDEGSLHDVLAFNSDTYWTDERENTFLRILEIINSLPENEKYIIIKRFGLDGSEPQTLEMISVHIGRTKERIRQIQNDSLRKIKRILDEEE
jgi:RNA polymerase sigma factor (sigma-70 family)